MKPFKLVAPILFAVFLLIALFSMVHQSARAQEIGRGPIPVPSDGPGFVTDSYMPDAVISNTFDSGDDQVHGLIYLNGYLWASTRTNPARVLKIDPGTLEITDRITLTEAEGEDIVFANGYLWVILSMDPARLVRIDLSTPPSWTSFLLNNAKCSTALNRGESLEYAFNYLWVGGRDALARVDISNPLNPTCERFDFSALNEIEADGGLFGSLASDATHMWGSYLQHKAEPDQFYATTMVKIDPLNLATSPLSATIPAPFPDDMVHKNGSLYASSEITPSRIYKFPAIPSSYESSPAADSPSYGLFHNPNDTGSVWAAYVGTPGVVKKFDLGMNPLLTIALPDGFNDPSEIAFDNSGNMYVSTWQMPSRIVKYPFQIIAPDTSDLSITISDSPDPVGAGGKINYILNVTNNGPSAAGGVVVTDTLPAQVSFLSSTPDSPTCSAANQLVTCQLGTLAAQSSRQIIIQAKVDDLAIGKITNTAEVSSAVTDLNQLNNTDIEETLVVDPATYFNRIFLPFIRKN